MPVDVINALPGIFMMLPIYLRDTLGIFSTLMGGASTLLQFIFMLVVMLFALICVIIFMWHLAVRHAEVFVLTAFGPLMFAFYPSDLDAIATGWLRRLFTTIIFGFFMIVGLVIFVVVMGVVMSNGGAVLLKLFLMLALFATLPKLKDLISGMINERSAFDGSSWKNLPGALIVSRQANSMQKSYMKQKQETRTASKGAGGGRLQSKQVNASGSGKAAKESTSSGNKAVAKGTPIPKNFNLKK